MYSTSFYLELSDLENVRVRKMITAVLKLAPHSADAHWLKAHYYLLRVEKPKTIAIWQQFTEKYPHNSQGWHYYDQCSSKVDANKQAGVNLEA